MTPALKLRMKTCWFSDLTVYNTITPTVPPWPPLIQLQKSLIFSRNPFFWDLPQVHNLQPRCTRSPRVSPWWRAGGERSLFWRGGEKTLRVSCARNQPEKCYRVFRKSSATIIGFHGYTRILPAAVRRGHEYNSLMRARAIFQPRDFVFPLIAHVRPFDRKLVQTGVSVCMHVYVFMPAYISGSLISAERFIRVTTRKCTVM